MKIRGEIEKAICRVSNLRIIGVMASHPSKTFTRYTLKKNTLLNLRDVENALRRLVEIGWVEELNMGGIKVYRLNLGNVKVHETIKFLKNVKYI
ncbi:MAG: hypothetical protein NDF56_04960 [archaeon GB-1845-036]|nr:hypothetical protein [Candidatus Culexmicrobium thermophilum]